jgi:uncharacterized membrane protein (UPF0127 family)
MPYSRISISSLPMKKVAVLNLTRSTPRSVVVGYASSFFSRLKGLMFHKKLKEDEGILLVQSRDSKLDSAIHMLFVGFPLGVVWISGKNEVVDRVVAKPWRLYYGPKRAAKYVLEIHPRRLDYFCKGDQVSIERLG